MLLRLRDWERLFALLVLASSDEDAESPPTPEVIGAWEPSAGLVSACFLCREREREVLGAAAYAPDLAGNDQVSKVLLMIIV